MTDSSRPSTASSTNVARDSIDLEKADGRAASGMDLEKQISPADASPSHAQAAYENGAIRAEGDGAGASRPATLTQTKSHRSIAGGDSYTVFPEDEGDSTPSEFVVTWDGEGDPLNPRSMSMLRRWVIVIIVSSSSLCV
jgi:hypothetical protein